MRGRLALAGIRPGDTPLDEYIDAEWAALCELTGPGEPMAELWAALTGEQVELGGGAPTADPERRGDQATVDAVRNLDDDQRRQWVPAYARALDADDDGALEELDAAWEHTASYAGGQGGLLRMGTDARHAAPSGPKRGGGPSTAFGAPQGGG